MVQLQQKFDDLMQNIALREMDQTRRDAVLKAVDLCPAQIVY